MKSTLLDLLERNAAAGKKQLAVLIDPDKAGERALKSLIEKAHLAQADFFFVGGSLLTNDAIDRVLTTIRELSAIPSILFPGAVTQLSKQADGILLLSLISGRNPEFLIGAHVVAAPLIKQAGIQVLPTAYMLIDGGRPTTVSYISNTTPIPADKPDIAACTAMAGEMLGLRLIYLDAGSGALQPVPGAVIRSVRKNVQLPIIVGGGIRQAEEAAAAYAAGADVVVVGNALEEDASFLQALSAVKRAANLHLQL
jgi:putative glycerol-1-phosphate prenyltransferase